MKTKLCTTIELEEDEFLTPKIPMHGFYMKFLVI